MDNEKLELMKKKKGFIAALDQSGGSSGKTLKLYGIGENEYNSEEEMFSLIHEMRKRVIKSPSFTSDKIIGVILFEKTMNSKIDDLYTSDYLWKKGIISFLKIDKGLAELNDGVCLMKPIPNLKDTLMQAKQKGIFGTKMRSVIKEYNEKGIIDIVKQQFDIAKEIIECGLVPIIEPEVDINCPDKQKCEELLLKEIKVQLDNLEDNDKVMFKFTIPTVPNYYKELMNNPKVVRVVALSGGYTLEDSCKKLEENNGLIASFSRALLENLRVNDTEEEFNNKLKNTISKIYNASIM